MNTTLYSEVSKMLSVAMKHQRKPPEEVDQEMVWIWCQVLDDVEPSDVLPALVRHMKADRWFPAPADVYGFCRQIADERAKAEFSRRAALPRPAPTPKLTSPQDAARAAAARERLLRLYEGDERSDAGPVSVKEMVPDLDGPLDDEEYA